MKLCLLALGLPACWARAQGLDLDQAFASALKRSEVLAGQQETLVQAEERFHQALGAVLPSLGASGQWFQQDASGLPASSAVPQSAWQTTYKVSASMPLFRGFREYAALAAAGDLVKAQQEALDWAGQQLYRDTAQAYYLVAALEKDLVTLGDEANLYAKRIRQLQERAGIGQSRKTEVLSAQAALASLKAQIDASQAGLASARELFAFTTGLPSDSLLEAEGPLPTLGGEQGFLDRLGERPDVLAAEQDWKAAKAGVPLAWGAHLPSADLNANYYFQRPGQLQNVKWDAQLSLTLPLFLGGTVASQTRQAESAARQAELVLSQVRRLALEDLKTSYGDARFDLAQALDQREAAALARRNYEAEAYDYNLGLVTNVEVLQALASWKESERALDRVGYAARTDLARLEAAAAKVHIPGEGDKP
jgi:outer membrane protein